MNARRSSIPLFGGLFAAILLLSACGPAAITTIPLSTLPPTEPATPQTPQANVTCGKITLVLDPALGSRYGCETVPESSTAGLPYWSVYPEYTEVTLQNYPLADTTFNARIELFPIQRYGELLPEVVPSRLADLQSLISGGTTSSKELPLLPAFDQMQAFSSQRAVLDFQNGKGLRYLTQYGQGPKPINNQDLIYAYQGLTTDGQYWVSIILPISSPLVMMDAKNPPNGQSWDEFTGKYTTYITDITTQFDAQSPESFTPTLTLLDALVRSIEIK